MRKLLITLDDELSPLLAKYTNQNEIVREALRLYIGDITSDTLQGLRASYTKIGQTLAELDKKLDYIANKIK